MIDVSGWREFRIGDIFEVIKGTRLTKANMEDGTIKFVGSSAINNGETYRISNSEHLHPTNTITVCYNGSVGETFYQDEEFWASDDVNVLYPKFDMNQYIAFFICPIIKSVGQKYAFTDKWKQEDMKNELIKLPITLTGEPDWQYMEDYMKQIMEESEESLENLKKADDAKYLIDVSEWGRFKIADLFDMSLPKGDLQVKKVEDGNIPLITPSNFNNGMLQRISDKSPSTLYDKGSLTVDMFGNAYYQEEDFFVTAHGHVNVLLPKTALNVYTGTFLASTIRTMFFDKYGFNEMCTLKVLKAESIKLPITSTGAPNWQYMENYMKQIINKAEKSIDIISKI